MDRRKYLKIMRDKYTQIANDDSVQGVIKENAVDMIAFINGTLEDDKLFVGSPITPTIPNWEMMVGYKEDEHHIAEGMTGDPPMPSLFAKILGEAM